MSDLPEGWVRKQVKELCRVTRGASPRPIHEWIAPTGTPWIKIADATADPSKYVTKTKEFIRNEGRSKSVVVYPGDLILSNSATPGIPKFLGIEACIHDGWLLLRNLQGIDPMYFYYVFLNDRKDLAGQGNGSIFTNLKTDIVKSHKLLVPTVWEQRAIAEVLGALDDKIAANTQLAATALELASTKFRHLVHSVPFSDDTFGDIATISGGGTPSTKVPEYWNGIVNWATPTDVTALQGPYLESTSRKITPAGLDACSSTLFPAGTILMTSRATIGAFAIAGQPTAVNQGFIVVEPYDPALKFWLFHEMESRVDEFISLANGATFLELSRGNFKKFKVRLAEPSAMKDFGIMASALHGSAAHALRENTTLAATRDALLPQLMSGRLRVRDAEKVLEDAV